VVTDTIWEKNKKGNDRLPLVQEGEKESANSRFPEGGQGDRLPVTL